MVIADTSIWIQFLRMRGSPEHQEIDRLLEQGRVAMVGPVLGELLQGARTSDEFERLRARLIALSFILETEETWLRLGELSFQLRQRGTPLPVVDVLIAALAIENDCAVYPLDQHFQRIPSVALHQAGG